MSQYTPDTPQQESPPLPSQPSYPYPSQQWQQQPYGQPLQKPPRKKRSRRFWITVGIIVLILALIGGIIEATGSGNPSPSSTASQATQPAQQTHTSAPTPTNTTAPTATPTQGPPRAVIDQIEKDIAYPYDPIVESYNQSTATVQVAFKYGYAVVVDPKAVKIVVGKHMEGYFHQHKDVYISKVTVQIYGTIRRGTAENGYGVVGRATMTRTNAQAINWIFASDDTIWSKCSNTWMDQGVIENA